MAISEGVDDGARRSAASTGDRATWSARRKLAVAGLLAGAWVVVMGLFAAIAAVFGLRPTPGAIASLLYALPSPSQSGSFAGYDKFPAAELNRRKQGHELRAIRYVTADRQSTSPAVVSVNPIDRFTWGAAALSSDDGQCYVVVALADRENPQLGSTKYGSLPPGSPCVGANATPQTATRDSWPSTDTGGRWGALVLNFLLFAPIALLAVLLVVRSRRQSRPARSFARMLPAFFLAIVAWWAVLLAVSGALDQAWNDFGFSDYTGAVLWVGVAGAIVEAASIGAMAPRRATLERRLAFAAVGGVVLAIPVAVIIVASSII